MRPDSVAPDAFFGAFGFVVLRQALPHREVDELRREADRVVRDATGPCYRQRTPDGGIEGHYVPATCEHGPLSLELALRFAVTAERLSGVPMLFAFAHHTLLFDAAGWHTDTGHDIPSVKVAAYLERLDAANGALRVLPCSHRVPVRLLRSVLQSPEFRDAADVPGVALATTPGDVIVFDEHLWHASHGGHDRLQWSAVFVKDPATPEEDDAVARFLESQFSPDSTLDYDPVRYPYYGEHFRRVAPPRWVEQLGRLGAFDAAAGEEASGRRMRPRA